MHKFNTEDFTSWDDVIEKFYGNDESEGHWVRSLRNYQIDEYKDADLSDFEKLEDRFDRTIPLKANGWILDKSKNNLLILGVTGIGKTHLAIAIMKVISLSKFSESITPFTWCRQTELWIPIWKYVGWGALYSILNGMSRGFKNSEHVADYHKLKTATNLIINNFGDDSLQSSSMTHLNELIRYRYKKHLRTIIISTMTNEAINQRFTAIFPYLTNSVLKFNSTKSRYESALM